MLFYSEFPTDPIILAVGQYKYFRPASIAFSLCCERPKDNKQVTNKIITKNPRLVITRPKY